ADQVVRAVEAALRPHAAELLSVQSVRELLDALERGAPALVHDTVPKPVTLRLLTEVLRRLLAEDVSIRPLDVILETLGSEAQHETDAGTLTERVRVRLGRQISFAHARDGVLALHPLDPMVEDALRSAARIGGSGATAGLALPPEQARDIVQAVRSALGQHASTHAALVAQADIRPHLRKLLEHELPTLAILGYAELAPELRVDLRKPVRVG
ncbi:MAG: FHIPEP family type III secretion protein, partial [Polyangiales bacterium]